MTTPFEIVNYLCPKVPDGVIIALVGGAVLMVEILETAGGQAGADTAGMREFGVAELAEALQIQRTAFLRDGPPSLALRRNRMDRVSALAFENAEAIADALNADFGTRPTQTTNFMDVLASVSDFAHIRRNLGRWMKPRTVMGIGRPLGLRTSVQAHPLGVVGIAVPWNGPIVLSVMPATAAFAAGNRVMIKMPEATPRTSALIARLAPQYFSPEELVVITGGPAAGTAFSALPLDHLLFTGSSDIAKHVQRSAADNLVPLTFELGGKNPLVVGRDADISTAASRTARGRLLNGGQVCLCPDYVFVPTNRYDEFVAMAHQQFRTSFPTVIGNPDYCSIVDDKNYERVLGLIEDARSKGATVIEANPDGEDLPSAAERKIAPTILTGVTQEMRVMTEEVFGPVLSVMPYDDLDEVIDYINARPSPLAAYWMGKDSDDFRRYCARTHSGGVTRNDIMIHAAMDGAPFGGVGSSGMGAYHGKAGFDTFTHYRTISESRLRGALAALAVPPIPARLPELVNWAVANQAARLRKRIDRYR
ncbi:MAG: coniferyl-aldehyde dehydrogenase [Mycobacterium sp.]|nr:coniferyl-aldehyde dehydrogenase [Mycobacterium sp.]